MTLAELKILSKRVGIKLKQSDNRLVTAESCTGGAISTIITDVAGSSNWFDRGFVTYSNEAKVEMLAVNEQTINEVGAVSEETATEMALGALAHSHATFSISVTGIAGPDGGTEDKPVGTVCFGWASTDDFLKVETCHFNGSRDEIRMQACQYALRTIEDILDNKS